MTSAPLFLGWSDTTNTSECVVMDDGSISGDDARIVVASGDEARIISLLEAGAGQVFVGEAALRDGTLIARLHERYEAGRIGVYVAVQRAAVSWSIDSHSNADFTCMVTSLPVPRWDALLSTGETTGTDAIWWAEQMVSAGASAAIFAATLDPDDLLLGAECVERLGERAWFATRDALADVEPWVRLAGARRFIVPDPERTSRAFMEAAA